MVYVFLAVFALLTAIPHFVTAPSSRAKRLLLYAARAPWTALLLVFGATICLPAYAFLLGFSVHRAMNYLQEGMEDALKQRHREGAKRVIDHWKPERLLKEEARPKPPLCRERGCGGRCQRRTGRDQMVRNSVPDWEALLSIWTFVAIPLAASYNHGWIAFIAWAALQAIGLVRAQEDRALFWKTFRLWALATHRAGNIRLDIRRLAAPPPEAAPEPAAAIRYRVEAGPPNEDAELDALLDLAEQIDKERHAKTARTA